MNDVIIHLTPFEKQFVSIYGSLGLGICLGYIFIKGLLSNWKA